MFETNEWVLSNFNDLGHCATAPASPSYIHPERIRVPNERWGVASPVLFSHFLRPLLFSFCLLSRFSQALPSCYSSPPLPLLVTAIVLTMTIIVLGHYYND